MLTTDELLWRAKYLIILVAIFWATSFAPPAAQPESASAVAPINTATNTDSTALKAGPHASKRP